jgi:hypothetical protein
MAGIFSRFFGSSVSVAAGVAIGGSVQSTLNPLTQLLANDTWKLHPDVPVDAVLLAIGVAQGQVDEAAARNWAAEQGLGDTQMTAMIAIADTGPGVAQAFDLWRRGLISEAGFRRAAKREALEPEWIEALVGLKRRLLSPAELANAVVQGFRSEPDAAADAALQGYDAADFQTMVDVTGLPPGPETLQEWTRRGIIDQAALAQGIREGHTKVKYIDEYVASLTRVLSATTYAGLHLRGWITEAEMNAGGALTGYSAADMNRLFLDRGRPATTHQTHIGWARGGRLAGAADERAAFSKAIKESDIRPEWEDILWAQRYTYPSAFVLRALTQAGDLTQAETHQILLFSGWEPTLATTVSTKWASGGAGAVGKSETKSELADEYQAGFIDEARYRAELTTLGFVGAQQDLEVLHADAQAVKTERGRVVTALHKLFVNHKISDSQARNDLADAGMHDAAIGRIMPLWTLERDAATRELTDAQIKAAYKASLRTLDAAVAELVSRGYTDQDARDYLAS